jgi:hypothetical protein
MIRLQNARISQAIEIAGGNWIDFFAASLRHQF